MSGDRKVGIAAAVGAFCLWGVLPLYWARISHVPAVEVISHRVVWGTALAWMLVVLLKRRGAITVPLFPTGATLRWLLCSGVLVVTNWLVYVWAILSGYALDASLGYYINPLVNVLLGMLFLGERLSALQWAAVGSAATGVLILTIRLGVFPWVSLTLACTFGVYGLLKKRSSLSSIHSLAVELTPLTIFAIASIVFGVVRGTATPTLGDVRATLFLVGSGVVTVAPLLLFGVAARRIRLSDVGFLQYIAPTLMMVIALTVFGDTLEPARLTGFIFVWIGLVLYSVSTLRPRGVVARS
ncbi:MAG: EamA family transporter RarD [Spirochaetales bacterium]|nr:EamA family transporter RarD [Spirochaetales bacterium]